jgi:hypothetical protein
MGKSLVAGKSHRVDTDCVTEAFAQTDRTLAGAAGYFPQHTERRKWLSHDGSWTGGRVPSFVRGYEILKDEDFRQTTLHGVALRIKPCYGLY